MKRLHYANGSLCPRCQRGRLATSDLKQVCDWCGKILWEAAATVPFRELREGERFYCGSLDHVWVKASDEDRRRYAIRRGMDSYRACDPTQHSGHGPYAPCVRADEITVAGSKFGYN